MMLRLVGVADELSMMLLSRGVERDFDPLLKQVLLALVDQLELSLPPRDVYSEFVDHRQSCILIQPEFVPFDISRLLTLRNLMLKPRAIDEPPLLAPTAIIASKLLVVTEICKDRKVRWVE